MRLYLIVIAFIIFAPVSFSDTLNVPDVYPTIQSAIDAAALSDVVAVSPGTYFENIDFIGKAITVKSTDGPEVTTIDGGYPPDPEHASVVTFANREEQGSVLYGFTITNGKGTYHEAVPGSFEYSGGGIFCYEASPLIMNNIIIGNDVGYRGGGIFCHNYASPDICDNLITENDSEGHGGGIYCIERSSPTVFNNTVSNNSAYYFGGGMYFYDNCTPFIYDNEIIDNGAGFSGGGLYYKLSEYGATVENNLILNNHVESGSGGGISCDRGKIHVTNNRILSNSADFGGGFRGYWANVNLKGNMIKGNLARLNGGGILDYESSYLLIDSNTIVSNTSESGDGGGIVCSRMAESESNGEFLIRNNLILSNSASKHGGGICCNQNVDPVLLHNTLIRNSAGISGGGISIDSDCFAEVINSILWENTAPEGSELKIGPPYSGGNYSSLDISYSNVKGGLASVHLETHGFINWGDGMIDSDPLFVDETAHDYHLTFLSPCRGSGINSTPGIASKDFEGDYRIFQGTTDMGADEFAYHFYCTGDFTPGGEVTANFVGLPGTWPVGLLIGSGQLEFPVQHKWGEFHLMDPLWVIPLNSIPADGVLSIEEMIPQEPAAPYDIPMQALIGYWLTNLFVIEVN